MNDLWDLTKDAGKAVYRFFANRLLWVLVAMAVLFYLLFAKLFELQILLADSYKSVPPATKTVIAPLNAPRGNIYDKNGRPLAVNKLTYTLKMDTSVAISNESLLLLAQLLERNGESYVDEFPISRDEPFEFTYDDESEERRQWREIRWKKDMTVADAETATAEESFEFLRRQFKVDPELTNEDARKILNFRCMIYMERYNPVPVTFAYDIKIETLAAVEEENMLFTGVTVDMQHFREYPLGQYFSHIIGYTGRINDVEYENNKDKGYSVTDIIGKTGIERSQENWLRGRSGSQTVEVFSTGRRTGAPPIVFEPEPGADVFLTVDAHLQRSCYQILYDMLRRIVINKIIGVDPRDIRITQQKIFTAFVEGNHIPVKRIMEADDGGDAYALRKYIVDRFPEADASSRDNITRMKTILTEGIEAGRISSVQMLLAMMDLGILTDDGAANQLRSGRLSAQQCIVEKINANEITPQMVAADPCSGSVVVVDVKNGDVLAAVSYPSYDNNRLVNNMDNEYYYQINLHDPTSPMVNRPFQEPRAPGSTFKMVTAVAALETGALTQYTSIYDNNSFTKAGHPYTNCMSWHGYINVTQALAVSCNYFFCETAWRLGNSRDGTRIEGINILNAYMKYFGFNNKTGVEIGEYYNRFDAYGDGFMKISSPAYKEFAEKERNPSVPRYEYDWFDGDMSRTSIGQGYNNYTPAMMAKYFLIIANRGVRYPLHLVNTVVAESGEVIKRYEAVPEPTGLVISERTWDIVIEGMRQVTERGTGANAFRDFPVKVAGKTGTAQQVSNRSDHYSFGCFAPCDDPRIAVYVCIPFGDTKSVVSPSAQVARDVVGEYMGLNISPEYPEATRVLTR